MNVIDTVILGIVQGLTEFLPVSSSAHLVLVSNLLGLKKPEILLDVSLHAGTLLAVCLFLRNDIWRMATELLHGRFKGPYACMAWMAVAATIPTAAIGFAFKDRFEQMFASVAAVGGLLIVTGFILLLPTLAEAIARKRRVTTARRTSVGLATALTVGVAQGLAIMPGISRSGSTMCAGLLCGLDREVAGRFSFLLSIPAIVGALVVQLHSKELAHVGVGPLLGGVAAAAVVGFLALGVAMRVIKQGRLYVFSPYCWAVGLAAILLS